MRFFRLRSDEQLVALYRAGEDDAFAVIHDRYQRPLLAYVSRVLASSRSDAEDVVQDVFVRASQSLRSHDRVVSLRAWLYRIARNACIDELRRAASANAAAEIGAAESPSEIDPAVRSEQREVLWRLVADLGRLPCQQRSALVMRELDGMSYRQVAEELGTSVSAVKSLLVRARLGLTQLLEARETACVEIRGELAAAYAGGVRPKPRVSRHLHDCHRCRQYRLQITQRNRALAALAAPLGLLGPLAKLLGLAVGGRAAGGVAGGAAAAGGGAGAGGAIASAGGLGALAAHLSALILVTGLAAAGAIELHDAGSAPSRPAAAGQRAAVAGSALTPLRSIRLLGVEASDALSAAGGAVASHAIPASASVTAPASAPASIRLVGDASPAPQPPTFGSAAPLGAGSGATCSPAQQPTGALDCSGSPTSPATAPSSSARVGAGGARSQSETSSSPTGAAAGGSSGAQQGSNVQSTGATGSSGGTPAASELPTGGGSGGMGSSTTSQQSPTPTGEDGSPAPSGLSDSSATSASAPSATPASATSPSG